jgi:ABC-2 type transport system ATP-binding protein
MQSIITIKNTNKVYSSGFRALNNINLTINKGEIFALLGPNGAGKTTLIGCICGTINASSGTITVKNNDNVRDYKKTRSIIGLVPQEIATEAFETVWATVKFSRGLFGKKRNDAYLEEILSQLSLWDKRHEQIRFLSGGMKRRLLIAKALSHEPEILFLDEPSAGVDVELRQSMWQLIKNLQKNGTTIIPTTHYIEEAEMMADRVGVIHAGELIIVDEKKSLMNSLGKKTILIDLTDSLSRLPESLASFSLQLEDNGSRLVYFYNTNKDKDALKNLLNEVNRLGINIQDVFTKESTLEEIFVDIIKSKK